MAANPGVLTKAAPGLTSFQSLFALVIVLFLIKHLTAASEATTPRSIWLFHYVDTEWR